MLSSIATKLSDIATLLSGIATLLSGIAFLLSSIASDNNFTVEYRHIAVECCLPQSLAVEYRHVKNLHS